jgi:hypothetical protein
MHDTALEEWSSGLRNGLERETSPEGLNKGQECWNNNISFSSSVSLVFVTFYFPLFENSLGLTRCMNTKRHFHPSFILDTPRTCKPNMSLSPAPSSSNLQHLSAHSVFLEKKISVFKLRCTLPGLMRCSKCADNTPWCVWGKCWEKIVLLVL